MRVYRYGALTVDNFTPRPGKDTMASPGKAPGLSTFTSLPIHPRRKCQEIELDRLTFPVGAVPDDPSQRGTAGHVALVPMDTTGQVNDAQLLAWAATRGTGQTHPFTQIILNAVVQVDGRRSPCIPNERIEPPGPRRSALVPTRRHRTGKKFMR